MEPQASPWILPDAESADEHGLVGVGADLEPGTVLAAYRRGLFPMAVGDLLGWWSPDPRGVLPLDGLHISRSLRKSMRRYHVTVDTDFGGVLTGCADPSRDGGWIDTDIVVAYSRLFELGWAHSIEVRNDDDDLVGGLYGVAIGRFFAGESMFHYRTDASKVALAYLVAHLNKNGAALLDVQWRTDHLATLGVIEIDRRNYVSRVGAASAATDVDLFGPNAKPPDFPTNTLKNTDGRT